MHAFANQDSDRHAGRQVQAADRLVGETPACHRPSVPVLNSLLRSEKCADW